MPIFFTLKPSSTMNTEQNFSGADDRLALINRMITQAKEDFADNSFNPLL
ncbi:MAG: hypothetical protein WKG07_02945 [Hymenobacter sp.]